MEVIIFATVGLLFLALFLWLMTRAARRGNLVIAGLFGALAISNPVAMFVPLILTGGSDALIGVFLALFSVAGTAWLAHRAYRNGEITRRQPTRL